MSAGVDAFGPWVAFRAATGRARLRLFCLPYAGGGASVFRTWPVGLPPDVEVCPIQLPGRETRLAEAPFSRLAALVDALGEGLRPYLDLPFALFGHSMGALVGFELARRLRGRYGSSPRHLFVSARRAPHLPERRPPIHRLPDPALVEELRRLNGTPEAVLRNGELMRLMLPALRADLAVCETYVHVEQAPLECPVSALGGVDDLEVPGGDLAAWAEQTRGPFALHMLPGDHFFLQGSRDGVLRVVADALSGGPGRAAGAGRG